MSDIKTPEQYLLQALAAHQQKPDNRLQGSITKKEQQLLLVAMDALNALETDYLAKINQALTIAERERAELKNANLMIERLRR